jgi:nucleoid-associated protein YgaU
LSKALAKSASEIKDLRAKIAASDAARSTVEREARATLADLSAKSSAATQSLVAAEERAASLAAENENLSRRLAKADADAKALSASLSASAAQAVELDALRARASTAERTAELAQAELARATQQLASRSVPATPLRVATATVNTPAPASRAPAETFASRSTESAGRVHTIAAGDTLSAISRRYYGTANRWSEILAANRDTLRDDHRLTVGRTLRIPGS